MVNIQIAGRSLVNPTFNVNICEHERKILKQKEADKDEVHQKKRRLRSRILQSVLAII